MNCNKLTNNKEIARLAQERFDEIYTVHDIMVGNTIEMMAECRKWVVENHYRDALFHYLMMEAIAIEGRNELEAMEKDIREMVWGNYDELTACCELERQLS